MFATTMAAQGLVAAAMGGAVILIPLFVMLVLHGESLVPYLVGRGHASVLNIPGRDLSWGVGTRQY